MGQPKLREKLSVGAYLEGETVSPIRYEYLHGEVYAMAGVSQNHSRITGNVFSFVRSLLNEPCEIYAESVKVRPSEEVFYYPDVFVTCEGEFRNKYICESPVLIIEVVSPSTERTDRREKLAAYKLMPSVEEIVLIDQQRIAIEVHRRGTGSDWSVYEYDGSSGEIDLASVGLSIPIDEVYRRVVFETKLESVDGDE